MESYNRVNGKVYCVFRGKSNLTSHPVVIQKNTKPELWFYFIKSYTRLIIVLLALIMITCYASSRIIFTLVSSLILILLQVYLGFYCKAPFHFDRSTSIICVLQGMRSHVLEVLVHAMCMYKTCFPLKAVDTIGNYSK